METVTRTIGNTKITIHSPNGLISMTPEQRTEWFQSEYKKGNPVVKRIVEAMFKIRSVKEVAEA